MLLLVGSIRDLLERLGEPVRGDPVLALSARLRRLVGDVYSVHSVAWGREPAGGGPGVRVIVQGADATAVVRVSGIAVRSLLYALGFGVERVSRWSHTLDGRFLVLEHPPELASWILREIASGGRAGDPPSVEGAGPELEIDAEVAARRIRAGLARFDFVLVPEGAEAPGELLVAGRRVRVLQARRLVPLTRGTYAVLRGTRPAEASFIVYTPRGVRVRTYRRGVSASETGLFRLLTGAPIPTDAHVRSFEPFYLVPARRAPGRPLGEASLSLDGVTVTGVLLARSERVLAMDRVRINGIPTGEGPFLVLHPRWMRPSVTREEAEEQGAAA